MMKSMFHVAVAACAVTLLPLLADGHACDANLRNRGQLLHASGASEKYYRLAIREIGGGDG